MTTFKDWFIFLGAGGLAVCNLATAKPLDYTLSRSSIQPGERTVLTLRLRIDPGERPRGDTDVILINDTLLTENPRLRLLENDHKASESEWIWTYELTSYEAGEAMIPPIEVQAGPDSYSTEATALTVTTSRSPDDNELRPEYDAIRSPFRPGRWLKLIAAVAFIFMAYRLGRKYLPRLRKRLQRPVPVPVPAPSLPEDHLEWLRQQLARIRAILEHSPQAMIVADELAQVLREFFSRKSTQPVRMWTTREFRIRLSNDPSATRMGPVFDTCDELRFTGRHFSSIKQRLGESLSLCEKVLLTCTP